MAISSRLWISALWAVAVSTFIGYHLIDALFPIRVTEIYFYVMRAVLGAMLSLTLLIEREPKEPYFWLAVYCGLMWTLNAICGFSWYVLTDGGHATALCKRDQTWVWISIGLCVAILWGLRRWLRSTRSSLQ